MAKIALRFQPEDGKITLKEATTVSIWHRNDSVGGEQAPTKVTEIPLELN